MPILEFKAEDFRCLENVELELDPNVNLLYGVNASGKTSVLEAMAYLGRGRSFRSATPRQLIRYGQQAFTLHGKVSRGTQTASIGVRNGPAGLEVRIDGADAQGVAGLAEALPLQIIDPDVHELVNGGPEARRRYLDWVAFHVEHEFLQIWRQFRRTLKQRNAALKAEDGGIEVWDRAFVELSEQLDELRRRALEKCLNQLNAVGTALLGSPVSLEYSRGWAADRPLAEVLADGLARDLQQGSTQAGPQRADLRLIHDDRQARKRVSRGQQKLLGAALVLSATEVVQTHTDRTMLLLLDDPAAELDGASLGRLMRQVLELSCQIVATALDPDSLPHAEPAAVFHVEQGSLKRL